MAISRRETHWAAFKTRRRALFRLFRALGGFRQSRPPVIALAVCGVTVVAAVFGNWLMPYSPGAVDFQAILVPPLWEQGGTTSHLLGTDQLGRDTLSRLIAGARVSLETAAVGIVAGGSIGIFVGLIAGYIGGLVGAVIMRVVDAFLALPFILMALAMVAALGPGTSNIMLVMVLTNWARYARLIRSEVLSIKERDFITLARIAGVHPARIMLRHVLPNTFNLAITLAVLDVGRIIILESSLSFLGVGIQPPDVSWGVMLADSRILIGFAWWLTVLPGLMIVLIVFSFNSVGEWLQRKFDPRGAR